MSDFNVDRHTGALNISLSPAASASVTNAKSDVAQQRDHLMNRLQEIKAHYSPEQTKLRELFALDTDPSPKTSAQLIDMIENKKYTLDPKKMAMLDAGVVYDDDDDYTGRPFYGIIWDGPKPDRIGYQKASEAFSTEIARTKDVIIVKSPDEGLAAIEALRAWVPPGKAN